jgi:hypothetical protein
MKYKGKTLNQLYRRSQRQTQWLAKLYKNCSKQLARLANLTTLHPSSLRTSNVIRLVYAGEAQTYAEFMASDYVKLVRRLGGTVTNLPGKLIFEQVQFSRIVVTVKIDLPFVAENVLANAA